MDTRVIQIREILKELARVENASNDEKEIVYDLELGKLSDLDRDAILEVVERAIGKDKKRRQYSPYIFSKFYDVPGIDRVFQNLLETSDANGRSAIIQTIGLRKLSNLVSLLNYYFPSEQDDFCRTNLLSALGKLADPSSLPIFEYLIELNNPRDEWSLLAAAVSFNHPIFVTYTKKIFEVSPSKSHKVMAAWSLAKSGDDEAYKYLVGMLDDPDIGNPNSYEPGESIRAAQAIADINGWEFQWSKSFVELVKQRLAQTN